MQCGGSGNVFVVALFTWSLKAAMARDWNQKNRPQGPILNIRNVQMFTFPLYKCREVCNIFMA